MTKYKILLDIIELAKQAIKNGDESKIPELERLAELLEEKFEQDDKCKSDKCRL